MLGGAVGRDIAKDDLDFRSCSAQLFDHFSGVLVGL
ncbi:Uncharacterised protein [Mycobacteroides abscessus subsp. massiliense]|nr:Uncharacterised protein [Mycobacteroides abscessus subsp. massiliense]